MKILKSVLEGAWGCFDTSECPWDSCVQRPRYKNDAWFQQYRRLYTPDRKTQKYLKKPGWSQFDS